MNDDIKLLKETVRDFSRKNIENISLKIEREGIGKDLVLKLSEQGFLGAMAQSKYGGSELDRLSYCSILEELASFSPSVAMLVFLYNSIVVRIMEGNSNVVEDISRVFSGSLTMGIGYAELLEGFTAKQDPGKNLNIRADVIFPGADRFIVLDEAGQNVILTKGKQVDQNNKKSLGIRGIGVSDIVVDNIGSEKICTKEKLMEAFDSSGLEIASINLGIVKGALDKAIEYAKVRTTFGNFLKDYAPVAFSLSGLRAEEEILRSYIYNEENSIKQDLNALIFSESLAKRATKQALQTHGGYGYLEDFGVEKFYRDAMAISIIAFRGRSDRKRLSNEVFEGNAGTL
ncbi:MAG: acyl-CoA dehydrogenase family protein [Thermoplasmataceae archaeon]